MFVFVVAAQRCNQFRDEAQQTNGASRCHRFGLHGFIFCIPNSAIGGFLSRLDFLISDALFDFGIFRFLQGQLVMSGLARGAFGVRQTARAESFDKPIELLFVFRTKRSGIYWLRNCHLPRKLVKQPSYVRSAEARTAISGFLNT
jgi:hypothetical protein